MQPLDQELAETGYGVHVQASMCVASGPPAAQVCGGEWRISGTRRSGQRARTGRGHSPTAAEPQAGRVEVTAAGEDQGEHATHTAMDDAVLSMD